MNKKGIATKKRGSCEPLILFYLLFNLHHAPFTIVIIQTVYPRRATGMALTVLPFYLRPSEEVDVGELPSEEKSYYL